jgi:hypothetical protein
LFRQLYNSKRLTPHVIGSNDLLRRMLTFRTHLDKVSDEGGLLRVIPGFHVTSESEGLGLVHKVIIYANAGDVLAKRPLISHPSGASIEGTHRHRRILHLEFAANEKLPDGYQWHDYIRPTICAPIDDEV